MLCARLLPPLDVAVVHLSHMLQSEDYHNFARTFGVGLEWLPHCCTWVYAGDDTMRVARDETIKASPVLERLYGAYDGWAVNTSFMGKITAVVKAALPAYKRVDADDDDRSGPACGIAAADPRVQGAGWRARCALCVGADEDARSRRVFLLSDGSLAMLSRSALANDGAVSRNQRAWTAFT